MTAYSIPGGSGRGLYAITDATLIPAEHFVETVEQAIRGGARVIQYRNKGADYPLRLAQAKALNVLCRRYGVPLIINDDVALAAEISAAGVHIGKDDPPFAEARARLGSAGIIGASCYNRVDLALEAVREGADYVAFGRFFASPTKPDAVAADVAVLRVARRLLPVPIVAIGGITPKNGRMLVEAGADHLAVISGVFGKRDIRAAAHEYTELYET